MEILVTHAVVDALLRETDIRFHALEQSHKVVLALLADLLLTTRKWSEEDSTRFLAMVAILDGVPGAMTALLMVVGGKKAGMDK